MKFKICAAISFLLACLKVSGIASHLSWWLVIFPATAPIWFGGIGAFIFACGLVGMLCGILLFALASCIVD